MNDAFKNINYLKMKLTISNKFKSIIDTCLSHLYLISKKCLYTFTIILDKRMTVDYLKKVIK